MIPNRLLGTFLREYPYQPATAIWRSAEVGELASVSYPPGIGLDLGCGDGRLTRILFDLAGKRRLVGVDIDPLETKLAEQSGIYERVHTAPANAIPELSATFDFIVSVSVLEHIADIGGALREVGRLLKPGGLFIASIPSVGFHACLRGPIIPWRSREGYLKSLDRRVAHLRYWSTDEWARALQEVGLTLTEGRAIINCGYMRRWEAISGLTAGVLQTLTMGKQPIEIQRSLGLRKSNQRMPRSLAALLGRVLSTGLSPASPLEERQSGCLLIIAARI